MKWTIRRKILAGFTTGLLFTLILSLFSLFGMKRLNRVAAADAGARSGAKELSQQPHVPVQLLSGK
jgi:CHASE3 domain sensor protein